MRIYRRYGQDEINFLLHAAAHFAHLLEYNINSTNPYSLGFSAFKVRTFGNVFSFSETNTVNGVIILDRDTRGRFLPGNQVARGNKGNRQPKWGNKNAVKTGEYERICFVNDKGQLVIQRGLDPVLILLPSCFTIVSGRVGVRKDILERIWNPG